MSPLLFSKSCKQSAPSTSRSWSTSSRELLLENCSSPLLVAFESPLRQFVIMTTVVVQVWGGQRCLRLAASRSSCAGACACAVNFASASFVLELVFISCKFRRIFSPAFSAALCAHLQFTRCTGFAADDARFQAAAGLHQHPVSAGDRFFSLQHFSNSRCDRTTKIRIFEAMFYAFSQVAQDPVASATFTQLDARFTNVVDTTGP